MRILRAFFVVFLILTVVLAPIFPKRELVIRVKYMAYACEPLCDDFLVLDATIGHKNVKTTKDITVVYKGKNLKEKGINGNPLRPGQILKINCFTPRGSFLRRFIIGENLVNAYKVLPQF